MSVQVRQAVGNQASYERFQSHADYMRDKFGKYWVDHSSLRSLKKPLPLTNIRTKAFEQLSEIPRSFSNQILQKYYSYEQKKQTIPNKHPIEKQLNDTAMEKMALIFANSYMNPLMDNVQEIREVLPLIQGHFQKFQDLTRKSPEDLQGKQQAEALIQDIHSARRKIHHNLFNLAMRAEALSRKIELFKEQGQKIGPAFRANPVIFLMGAPMSLPKNSGLTEMDVTQAIGIIEDLKQQKSVAEGVEPFYLLFLNATRGLLNMEKGMGRFLGDHFQIPSGFKDTKLSSKWFNASDVVDVNDRKEPPAVQPTKKDPYVERVTNHLCCPLTKALFKDPVTLETGYSFEREALVEHLKTNNQCPRTGATLSSKEFLPNFAIKSISQRFAASPSQSNFFQQIPDFDSCVTLQRLTKPVIVSNGITYESEDADTILAGHRICYITRTTLTPGIKIPNFTLLELMKAAEK